MVKNDSSSNSSQLANAMALGLSPLSLISLTYFFCTKTCQICFFQNGKFVPSSFFMLNKASCEEVAITFFHCLPSWEKSGRVSPVNWALKTQNNANFEAINPRAYSTTELSENFGRVSFVFWLCETKKTSSKESVTKTCEPVAEGWTTDTMSLSLTLCHWLSWA